MAPLFRSLKMYAKKHCQTAVGIGIPTIQILETLKNRMFWCVVFKWSCDKAEHLKTGLNGPVFKW